MCGVTKPFAGSIGRCDGVISPSSSASSGGLECQVLLPPGTSGGWSVKSFSRRAPFSGRGGSPLSLDTCLTVGVDRSFRWALVSRSGLIASVVGRRSCGPGLIASPRWTQGTERVQRLVLSKSVGMRLSPRPTPHACGMADTQPGRSFDTRRSAGSEQAGRFTSRSFSPWSFCALGELRLRNEVREVHGR